MPQQEDLTAILTQVREGKSGAVAQLFELVYHELHQMAHATWKRLAGDDTLQPTALVNEVYMRLIGRTDNSTWESRRYFFAAAAQAMRDILVEQARRHAALKRGGGRRRIPLTDDLHLAQEAGTMLELSELIDQLRAEHPTPAEVLMLHYFAGRKHEEVASMLGLSHIQTRRAWDFARAWLRSAMDGQIT